MLQSLFDKVCTPIKRDGQELHEKTRQRQTSVKGAQPGENKSTQKKGEKGAKHYFAASLPPTVCCGRARGAMHRIAKHYFAASLPPTVCCWRARGAMHRITGAWSDVFSVSDSLSCKI